MTVGTGKSETGAHIAYTFAMANRQLESPKKCVVYCGPSNKSVDVVLGKMPYTTQYSQLALLLCFIDGCRQIKQTHDQWPWTG